MLNLIFILFLYTLDVLLVEFLYRIKFSSFYTRKVGHILGAIISIWMINLLPFWGFILVCSILTLVNFISHKFGVFNSIERAETDSIGTILYPISLLFLGVVFWEHKIVYQGSVAIMGFADSAAALVGKSIGKHHFGNSKKTLEGFSAFVIVTLLILFLVTYRKYGSIDLLQFGLISVSAVVLSFVEFISKKGTDNISIPLLSSLLLSLLII